VQRFGGGGQAAAFDGGGKGLELARVQRHLLIKTLVN
jgi:hypothetical protein